VVVSATTWTWRSVEPSKNVLPNAGSCREAARLNI
jgi:hypothetical protein